MSAVLAKPQVKDFLKTLAKGKEKGQEQRKEHDVNAHAVTAEGEPSKKPWEEDIPELSSPSYSPPTSFSYSSDSSTSSNPRRQKLLVILRDGRKLIGILRSFDQFANVVIEGAVERIIVGDQYCDVSLGLYIIRGENVVLIGELDSTRDELPAHMQRVSRKMIEQALKAEKEATELKGSMRKRMEFLDLE
ncbi:hypothetical protein L7F22_059719 [Adiantum nelumboides]|nr:hypothetical protein [Adiantum nelumboides]